MKTFFVIVLGLSGFLLLFVLIAASDQSGSTEFDAHCVAGDTCRLVAPTSLAAEGDVPVCTSEEAFRLYTRGGSDSIRMLLGTGELRIAHEGDRIAVEHVAFFSSRTEGRMITGRLIGAKVYVYSALVRR